MKHQLNICVFEPDHYARKALTQAIGLIDGCRIIGESDSVCGAEEILGRVHLDLVITDIQLSDGLCTDFLFRRYIDIPVILMVGCEDAEGILKVINPFRVIPKPVSEREIAECIDCLVYSKNNN